jgi:prephenate dehydratase
MQRIGIQGVKASFHEVAARQYFEGSNFELVECASFKALSTALHDRTADRCVMAIENSIAGSILTNYSLLERYGFKILGEVYRRIEMSLVALPGQRIEDLHTVQSHPMALLQVEDFLAKHPNLKVLEGADTAESARRISANRLMGYGAIAHALAARTYGLEILAEGIETNKENYTRFLIICRSEDYVASPVSNKASICFEVPHRSGSLAHVLEIFSRHEVNMTKIQSIPILGKPYQYSFHVDLEWSDRGQYDGSMASVAGSVTNLIRFGEYPRGEKPFA